MSPTPHVYVATPFLTPDETLVQYRRRVSPRKRPSWRKRIATRLGFTS